MPSPSTIGRRSSFACTRPTSGSKGSPNAPRWLTSSPSAVSCSIPIAEDLGSGFLGLETDPPALRDEPAVRRSIEAGADVVMFSGDKLLGGPQAGIIAGSESILAPVRRHPLMRALRADKMTYAALESTLQEYAAGRAAQTIPVARMVSMTEQEIESRANRIVSRLTESALNLSVVPGTSTIGGGSAPGSSLPTRLIAISHSTQSAAELEGRLRGSQPPIVARIENDQVLIDLRTVLPDEDDLVIDALSLLAS